MLASTQSSVAPEVESVRHAAVPRELTPRERQIVIMIANGSGVKDIAREFELSVKTVEAHKFNLMKKLDLHKTAQIVHYAIRNGIVLAEQPILAGRSDEVQAATSTEAK